MCVYCTSRLRKSIGCIVALMRRGRVELSRSEELWCRGCDVFGIFSAQRIWSRRCIYLVSSLRKVIKSLRSLAFLRPPKAIFVPGMYFLGFSRYSNYDGMWLARCSSLGCYSFLAVKTVLSSKYTKTSQPRHHKSSDLDNSTLPLFINATLHPIDFLRRLVQ